MRDACPTLTALVVKMDIIPRFDREGPGSNPGWGTERVEREGWRVES